MDENDRRPLTPDERRILGYIREIYGDMNTEDEVFFSDNDEAVIFVKEFDGSMPVMVVLTNVAVEARELDLNRDEICRSYLIPDGNDPESQAKIQELKALPLGLRVTHAPSPVSATTDSQTGYTYAWIYSTTVEAIDVPVVIEEFGVFDRYDDIWMLANFSGDPYTRTRFAEWYACPAGTLDPGTAYTDPTNSFGRDELCPGENLWYFVGRDPDGRRVWGAATIELLGELEDVSQGSEDQSKSP